MLESAVEIVTAVVRKERPRSGRCVNGYEYFVHGAGYTVVLPSGGQVHLDGSGEGDVFTAYDMAHFLEDSGVERGCRVAEVRDVCDELCDIGVITKAARGYVLLR